MMSVLNARGLATGYIGATGTRIISRDLFLDVNEGTLTCLMGPNGIGKSTLLRTLSGLQKKIDGKVSLGGRAVESISKQDLARKLSLVLTDILDLGNMTVQSLVSMGRFPYTGLLGRLTRNDRQAVEKALEQVGAVHLTNKKFMEISDGEKQKVQIARALAQDTPLLILDEPTVYLDLPGRIEILGLLKKLSLEKKISVLISTHELDLAFKISDEIWIMQQEGNIIRGAPEDLILNGSVQETFENEHFSFEMETGDIRLNRNICTDVSLTGSGTELFWTRRALERIGFSVVDSPQSGKSVVVEKVSGKLRWIWNSGSEEKKFDCIADLIRGVSHS